MLRLEKINYKVGDFSLNNIDFSVNKGDYFILIGESGSGKSVTAMSILRLIPDPPGKISHGSILFSDSQKGVTDLLR